MELSEAPTELNMDLSVADNAALVKFESEQLPEILNALETDNSGNKLILEVSVRASALTCP